MEEKKQLQKEIAKMRIIEQKLYNEAEVKIYSI
jgi:hypothetical protein